MRLSSVLLLTTGALAVTTPSSPLAKRDASPGCGTWGCWSLCDKDTMKPIGGEWNDGYPWYWLWTGYGHPIEGCGPGCPAPDKARCLPFQEITDETDDGGCS